MIYSPLRYPGSKRRVMNELLPMFPDGIKDWREPFMGSLSVTLAFIQSQKAIDCERIVAADLNPEIYAFWEGVKRDPQEVHQIQYEWVTKGIPSLSEYREALKELGEEDKEVQRLDEILISESRDFWKELQSVDCSTLGLSKRAARLYLVNKLSFSGMGDSGSLGLYQTRKFVPEKGVELESVSKVIQNVYFVNKPFQETVKDVTKDTFIFFDPPYYAQEGAGLYGRNGDLHKGFPHKEFGNVANGLKCNWLITYDDSPFVRRMFRGKYINTLYIRYSCSYTHAEDSLDGEELLISNYDINGDLVYDL